MYLITWTNKIFGRTSKVWKRRCYMRFALVMHHTKHQTWSRYHRWQTRLDSVLIRPRRTYRQVRTNSVDNFVVFVRSWKYPLSSFWCLYMMFFFILGGDNNYQNFFEDYNRNPLCPTINKNFGYKWTGLISCSSDRFSCQFICEFSKLAMLDQLFKPIYIHNKLLKSVFMCISDV